MTASTTKTCHPGLLEHKPAALPNSCSHTRLIIGLDRAYCPDCRGEFRPRSPEYRAAVAPPTTDNRREKCSCVTPKTTTHEHWVQTYWVKRGPTKHQYYRYCYQLSHDIRSCIRHHIPGGNIKNPIAIARSLEIKSAIASGKSPQEIEQLIKSWKAPHEPQ